MENYQKVYFIGKGAYGTVYKVKCLTTGKDFALKCHSRGVEDAQGVEDARGVEDATVRELSCLTALRGHPYVIQMQDCFVDSGKIAMLMPYVPYTLTEAIHNRHGLIIHNDRDLTVELVPLSFVAHFSVQVANALSYMHRLNIVHRDLTPTNVLLTEDLTVKVADMGLSRQSLKWMSSPVATEPYRAPEVFLASGKFAEYTCAIDMWSLGVMIADAMEGKVVFLPPSETVSSYQIIVRTLCPKGHPLASITPLDPENVMPNVMECELVKRIVLRLLAFSDKERLMAYELLKDTEWMWAAQMTPGDIAMVKKQIQRNKMRQ